MIKPQRFKQHSRTLSVDVNVLLTTLTSRSRLSHQTQAAKLDDDVPFNTVDVNVTDSQPYTVTGFERVLYITCPETIEVRITDPVTGFATLAEVNGLFVQVGKSEAHYSFNAKTANPVRLGVIYA